ncbi:hypothetical protein [Kaistella polysaccharea]|uniref:hypothetical protein n=1 Tax=Kaistella polysaccharea TaxID=2878534 RepID=UPI001CF20BB4|nr:hypothetical protein [Kaistella polysaccharea]
MLRNRTHQKFLATLFAGVYLFVALFSQNFHEHGSGEILKDFHFTKVDKTFSTSSKIVHYTDCLSCHFLHEAKYITAQAFFFKAIAAEELHLGNFSFEKIALHSAFYNYYLRGPPVFFI